MKLRSKIAASIAAGALAFSMLGVTGCGSSQEEEVDRTYTTEEIDAQDLEVTQVGFMVLDDQTLSYAFTISNPNEGYVATGATFQIEGYDADGVMLVGGGETVQQIYPGIETGAAGSSFLSAAGEIDRFEVTPIMEHVTWEKTDLTAEQLENMFELTDTEVTTTENSTEVTGTISVDLNTLAGEEASDDPNAAPPDARVEAHVVAILKDASGNILCGGSSMGIMLDPSMVKLNIPSEDEGDEEGAEPAESAEEAETPSGQIASTTFTISIPGLINFATCDVLATPGI